MRRALFLTGVAATLGTLFTIIICTQGWRGHITIQDTCDSQRRKMGPNSLEFANNMPIISQNTNSEACRAFFFFFFKSVVNLQRLTRVKEGVFETKVNPRQKMQ